MAVVLVFGSINTDLVVYLSRLPGPGETITGGTFASFPGGKGANTAVAAARAGVTVRLHGAVGADTYGRERLEGLLAEGIDVRGVLTRGEAHTGVAQIRVAEDGENSIAVSPGANWLYAASDARIADTAGAVAAFQNEIPQDATESLIRVCKSLGHVTVWNVAPGCSRPPDRDVLRDTDYLVVNEHELAHLARLVDAKVEAAGTSQTVDQDHALALARAVQERGVGAMVVTLGSAGSLLVGAQKGPVRRQKAFSVVPTDTVGAGDCFCGVFAASLADGHEAPAALERAAAAAAISVTRRGAQTSMPRRTEIDGLLRAG
jgi:ribokinase